MMKDVLVLAVSQDSSVCNSICEHFDRVGFTTICVSSPTQVLRFLEAGLEVEFVLLDASQMRPEDGLVHPLVSRRKRRETIALIVAPGDSSWNEFAANWSISMISKTTTLLEDLGKLQEGRDSDERALHLAETLEPNLSGRPSHHIEELDKNRFFLAGCPAMMQVYRDVRLFAPVDLPVLILGESGVGKENIARLLHKYHPRSEKSLVSVNCAALPNELLESEMFGYEAGAFTGATKAKPGIFDLAHKGTLLLDEIGEMSPRMQAKLLHVLQDGTFSRLGARSASQVDVRVLAATNIDIENAIEKKTFREDLYYRLNTLTITVPPLRERREEIPLLMREMFTRGAQELGQPEVNTEAIIEAAHNYNWPGNLRELRNFVTRTLILRNEKTACQYLQTKTRPQVAIQPLPEAPKTASGAGMKDAVSVVRNETEARMLKEALSASGWNRRRAASNLNISYRTLLYKIQQHGLRA